MARLISLELENFQSIAAPTKIDFAPITLLYGPNSAGKSSIFDALELIEAFWNPRDDRSADIHDMATRWARHAPGTADHRESWLRLSVTFQADAIDPWDSWNDEMLGSPVHAGQQLGFGGDDFLHEIKESGLKTTLEFRLTTTHEAKTGKTTAHLHSLQASLAGKPLLYCGYHNIFFEKPPADNSINSDCYVGIYHSFDFCDDCRRRKLLASFDLHSIYPVGAKTIEFNGQEIEVFWGRMQSFKPWPFELNAGSGFGDSYLDSIAIGARQLLTYFGGQLADLLGNAGPTVKADRRVPTREDSLFLVSPDLEDRWGKEYAFGPNSAAAALQTAQTHRDPHFQRLAKYAHASLICATENTDWERASSEKIIQESRGFAAAFEKINHWLDEYLFQDALYQVRSSSTLLVPLDLTDDPYWSGNLLTNPAAVRLYLIDSTNKPHEFADVGSGVSYVLPVVVALLDPTLTKIQQPELHLHPALQSKLGDLLNDATAFRDACTIVETHSEHLLLRLLRRIRETGKGKATAHPLSPDQLAIYYFDPIIGRESVVTRQLVTPLGDFYTDWPRGFFDERRGDLFDEL